MSCRLITIPVVLLLSLSSCCDNRSNCDPHSNGDFIPDRKMLTEKRSNADIFHPWCGRVCAKSGDEIWSYDSFPYGGVVAGQCLVRDGKPIDGIQEVIAYRPPRVLRSTTAATGP